MNRESQASKRIGRLLILSVSLMPFTALKIGHFGPAELIILICYIYELKIFHGNLSAGSSVISKRFFVFLVICFAGTFHNLVFYVPSNNRLSAGFSSIGFDMLSYFFIHITLLTFGMYENADDYKYSADEILQSIVLVNCFTMPILYVLSLGRNSLFGMRLRYYIYFAPLATNLHHTSMYLLPLSFATIYIAETRCSGIKRILLWLFAVFFMYLAYSTGSTKALMSLVLSGIVSVFYKINSRRGKPTKWTTISIIVSALIVLLYLMAHYSSVIDYALRFFTENDIANGRETIWRLGLNKWKESFVVGYGFGSHVELGTEFWDAHNTLLTVLLQAGVVGLVVFGSLWIFIIRYSSLNGYILAMNLSILIYTIGGDVLRRIPCWSFIILSYYIIQKPQKEAKGSAVVNFSTHVNSQRVSHFRTTR